MPTVSLASLLTLACFALVGCSRASDPATEAIAAPSAQAPPAPIVAESEAPRGASAAQCRDRVGPRVEQEQSGSVLTVVGDHTVALTTDTYGPGCLIVLERNVTAAQLAPGEPFPYAYFFFVTDATGDRVTELAIDTPLPAASLVAVGFDRLNDDGDPEILAVHDAGPALVWVSFEPGRWTQDTPAPGEAGVSGPEARSVRDLKAHYRDWFSTPVSP